MADPRDVFPGDVVRCLIQLPEVTVSFVGTVVGWTSNSHGQVVSVCGRMFPDDSREANRHYAVPVRTGVVSINDEPRPRGCC